MNRVIHAFIFAYRFAIRLYPAVVQSEYGEEMAAVFAESCHDTAGDSFWSSLKIGLIEVRDLPGNLIREHWLNFRRNKMRNYPGPARSFPQSVLRGLLGFGVSFLLFNLVYCFIDVLINSGKTMASFTNIWNLFILHPTALASGVGAIILGTGCNRLRLYSSAIVSFLGFILVRTWGGFLIALPPSSYNSVTIFVFPFLFMTLVGILIGGGIGLFQRGWHMVGRYAIAGMAGFVLGWFIDRVLAAEILIHSPFYGYIDQLVIGSPTYFVYMLVPTVFYGSSVGLCLGMATFIKVENPLLVA